MERPILFSAPMVRAILSGTKTQTRRVVNGLGDADMWAPIGPEPFHPMIVDRHGEEAPGDESFGAGNADGSHWVRCPYGQPGDRLWVRETWGYFDPRGTGEDYDNEHETPGPGPAAYCDELLQEGHPLRDFWRRRVAYKATFAEGKYGKGPAGPKKWRPSIHMPRWASRITLEVTGVRVERLQDISEADAVAEGLRFSAECRRAAGCMGIYECELPDGKTHFDSNACDLLRNLWESIYGPGSWDENPWVWAITFKRLEAKL